MKKVNLITGLPRRLETVLESMAFVFLVLVLVTILLQVVFRYVLGWTVPWTAEAARYACVWMVFTGCAVCAARDSHIRVTYLVDRMPVGMQNLVGLATFLILVVFDLIILLGAFQLAHLNWEQQATTIPVSIAVLYIALVVFSTASLVFHSRKVATIAAGLVSPGSPWKS